MKPLRQERLLTAKEDLPKGTPIYRSISIGNHGKT
jgi:hypothetical protein